MRTTFLFFFAILTTTGVMAQQPFVTGLDKTSGFFGETVTISGQNFTGSLQVNFGAGRATSVTQTSANQLQVAVPSTATDGFVTVTSLVSGLSGSSAEKFTLKYGGASLTAGDFNTDFELETNGQFSWGLCSCDLDMDGDLDVVTTSRETSHLRIFLNMSTPTATLFSETSLNSISNPMRNVTCGDLNGDGKPEIITGAVSGTSLNHIFIMQNTNTTPGVSTFDITAFNNSIRFRLPDQGNGNVRAPQQIGLADLDGDGKNELIVGNSTDNILFIYQNTSTLSTISFSTIPTEVTVPNSVSLGAFDVGDINGDNRPDIVTIPGDLDGQVSLVVNNSISGSLDFEVITGLSTTATWISVALIDLDNNGTLEIAAANSSSINNFITISNNSTTGTIAFGAQNNVTLSSPYILSSGDLDGNGNPDLAVSSLLGRIYIFINNGSVILPTPIDLVIPVTDASNPETIRFLQVADINQDAKPDIAYISRSRSPNIFGQFGVAINRNCFAPTISPSNQTFCLNSPFTVESIPGLGLSYSWSVVSGSATFSNQTGRQVDVTVTSGDSVTIQSTITSNDGLCVSNGTQGFTITGGTVPPAPTITSNQAGTICFGEDFTLSTPNPADTWVWTQPDGTVTNSSTLAITDASSGDAGSYTLRIKNGDECTSEAGTFNVVVDQPPLISIVNNGEDNFCSTNSTELEVANYAPEFDYRWYRDNTLIDSQTSTSLTVTQSGSYTAEITSLNSCALTSTAYVVTAVTPPASDFNSNNEICVDVSLDFAAVSTGVAGFALDYAWDFGDGNTATGANVSHAFTAANTYTVQLTTSYADVNVCEDVITKDILVSAIPTIDITAPDGSFEKCPSDSVRLELPQNYQSYSWSTGDTTYFTYAKTADRFETSVTIDVDATTNVGCDITSTTDVSNFANSNFTITSNAGLFARDTLRLEEALSSVDLTASGGSDFTWAPGTLVSNSSGATTNVFPNTEFNVVALTGTDVNGCTETINLVIVNPGLLPRQTFSPNGDGMGYECWEIANSDQVTGCELFILDSRGRIIHEATSPFTANCAWDGTVDGGSGAAPEGIYFFVLKCENEDLNLTGSILLGR